MTLLDNYKKAAARISEFLSDRHRVKLPRAAALELIAVAHGARNWQTLSASGPLASVKETGSAQPADRFPIQWNPRTDQPVFMSAQDWFRHTVVTGNIDTRREWFSAQFAEHAKTERAGLFVGLEESVLEALRGMQNPDNITVLEPDDILTADSALYGKIATGGYWCTAAPSGVVSDALRRLVFEVCQRRTQTPGVRASSGFTVAVSDEDPASRLVPDQVYTQGRACKIAVVVGASTPLIGVPAANVFNSLHLSPGDDVLDLLKERLAASSAVLCTEDSVRFM
jgi:hypothetical protein